MTDDLLVATTPRALGPRSFALDVPAGWAQGRGAFGGLVLAAMLRAIESCEPDSDRRLRSLTGELVGPVLVGPSEIAVEELRRGSGVSSWTAVLRQGDAALARASVLLGKPRDAGGTWQPQAEPMPPWRDTAIAAMDVPFAPEFARNLEFRPTGPLPFSGAREPIASGWIRARVGPQRLGAPELVALADAWWPSTFSTARAPGPIATVAFTLQSLLGARTLPADVPLFHRARAVAAGDGYFVEHRELWTETGELVALNQQTFAWIR